MDIGSFVQLNVTQFQDDFFFDEIGIDSVATTSSFDYHW